MLDGFQSINLFSTNVPDMLVNILVAFICGMFIAWLYKITYKGPGYSVSFVNSIVLLSMITSVVIMVIGNNLARAFGLVGTLSIIRFRTAIKDTMDIVYIFLGLTIGMAAGVGYHKIAIAGTIMVGLILMLFSKPNFKYFTSNQYILQFSYANGDPSTEEFSGIISNYCKSYEIINIRSIPENITEYTFYLMIKKSLDSKFIINDLQKIKGIANLNIYFDRQNS